MTRLALLLVLLVVSVSSAWPPFDLKQQQSPPKPQPAWLKTIDQGDRDPRLKGYITPTGVKLEIVVEAPVVVNPVGMTFAADGTLHVLEWVPAPSEQATTVTFSYKDGSKRKVNIMKKPVKDLVKALRDTQDKGVYDKADVVLEDELPSSILIHHGWIYLSGQGTVRRWKQSKPGGPYDHKEVIAQGFCGFHHHQVSGLSIGNDGWLYVTAGDDDNFVEGSDGSRADVLRTGAVFRCRLDGSKLHTYALGFRNPYRDVVFDSAMNMFHVDNDNEDGSKFTGCRLMHVAEGNDFGWRLRSGARCCVPDPVRAAAFGELPGTVTPLLKTGRGAPAGLLIYNDTRFPAKYRGLLYYPDVLRRSIRAYKVEPHDGTFAVAEEFELVKSNDPLFRPCQMVVGPDGAMYICDWRTDSGGAGKLWGDGKNGRVYRLSWTGVDDEPALPLHPRDRWAKLGKLDDAALLKVLGSEDATERQHAQHELRQRGDKLREALLKLLEDAKQPLQARLAALGVVQSFWNDKVSESCIKLLMADDAALRRLAADALGLHAPRGNRDAHEALVEVLNEQDSAARRAIILALGRINCDGVADVLANALSFDDGKDEYLRDGIVRACEYVGKPAMRKLLDLADSGVPKDLDRVVEAASAMRTREAAAVLPALLKNMHLSNKQRADLLHSFNNYLLEPPLALDPVVDYLHELHSTAKKLPTTPENVRLISAQAPIKLAGLEVLAASNALQTGKAQTLLLTLLADEADSELRIALVKAIEQTRLAKAGPALTQLLGDSAKRPAAEQRALLAAVSVLREPSVAPLLTAWAQDKQLSTTVEGAVLRSDALRALALIEPAAARKAATAILSEGEAALFKDAAAVLATEPGGAKLLGERFVAKKLPRELLPQVAEALRQHVARQPELTPLLNEVMRGGLLIALDAQEQQRVRALVKAKGNAERGRKLYLGKTLACSACHRLEGGGGQVGPDLTRVWETHSVEKVMEALLDPSQEIKEGYQSYVATTKNGQVLHGLKISQSAAEVVLRDATGKDIRIPAKDLDELTASRKSLMPDDVVRHLSFEQFLDLVAFLNDRTAQEALRKEKK